MKIKRLEKRLVYSDLVSRVRGAIGDLRNRYSVKYMCIDPETGDYNQDLIAGLCEKKDSCDQCRSARKADEDYQRFLSFERSISQLHGKVQVASDLESRAMSAEELESIYAGLLKDWKEISPKIVEEFGL